MTSDQTDKLAMYVRLAARLKAILTTTGIAGLPARLAALVAWIVELNSLAQIQTQGTEGQTAQRDEQLAGMTGLAMETAGAVAAYADDKKLSPLAHTVDVAPGDFDRVRILHRPWLAQRIHDAAQGVLADLADYGVTADTLKALQDQIDLVQGGFDQPRATIELKRVATERMAVVFAAADAVVENQIDRLVLPLRRTNPEAYALFQAARMVVSTSGSSLPADAPAAPAA